MIPVIDLKYCRKRIEEQVDLAIKRVLEHGKFILGPEVSELEVQLENYTGAESCVTCANGTDALQIALMALGIGPGDEVLTPAFSYIASSEAVSILGAKPIYIDIESNFFNIDHRILERHISKKTKAIIAVSLFGQPPDFDKINEIAEKYKLAVIEDAAQSFGASYKNKKSCNLATIGCTSFFPTKPLGCYGDGGAIFTSDPSLAKIIRQIARHGQEKRYVHIRDGMNSRLDTIQAAILLEKLKLLDLEIGEREIVAQNYFKLFQENENDIALPTIKKDRMSAWAQFSICVSDRNIVKQILSENGVETAIHYPKPIPYQPCVNELVNVPISLQTSERVLSLPISGNLSVDEQSRIVSLICNAAKKKL